MTPEIATLALRDLEYIVAIAENRNFRLAAKACSVSQPALSTQIKKVELALDVQLFERTNREVLVTAVGEKIVEQCRVVLEELETLGSIARGAGKPLEGSFRLGVIPSLCPYLMPDLQKPLIRKFPKLDLVIREASGAMLLEALRIGKLDAVIASYPLPKTAGNLTAVPLFKEPLQIMLHKQDPLTSKKSLRASDLDPEQMVYLDEHFSLTDEALSLLKPNASDLPSSETHTTTVEAMCFMVAFSRKQAIVPYLASQARRSIKDVCFIPLQEPQPARTLALVWRPRYSGFKAVTDLADLISEVALKKHSTLQSVQEASSD